MVILQVNSVYDYCCIISCHQELEERKAENPWLLAAVQKLVHDNNTLPRISLDFCILRYRRDLWLYRYIAKIWAMPWKISYLEYHKMLRPSAMETYGEPKKFVPVNRSWSSFSSSRYYWWKIRLFNKLALEHFETNGNKKAFNYENMRLRGANMSMVFEECRLARHFCLLLLLSTIYLQKTL